MRKADHTAGGTSRKGSTSRRRLLAGVAAGLGASILVQPNGGVVLAAMDSPETMEKKGKKKGGKKKGGDDTKKDAGK